MRVPHFSRLRDILAAGAIGILIATMSPSLAWAQLLDRGLCSSIGLDPQGNPRISYMLGEGSLWLATHLLDWEKIDAGHTQVTFWYEEEGTSLALDEAGDPWIACGDAWSPLTLWHAADGVWGTEALDQTGGGTPSLALDGAGHPNIAYHAGGELRLARWDGSSWQIETVDASAHVGAWCSLELESDDHPAISYYDETNDDLKFATQHGGTWAIAAVDQAGLVGKYTSLALEADDDPAISYFDETSGTLKIAVRQSGTWQIESVDAAGDVLANNSLALDASGDPAVAYASTSGGLRFAEKHEGAWVSEPIMTGGWGGNYISLAFDGQSRPHVSFHGAGLAYGMRSGTTWSVETVDAVVGVPLVQGGTPSLAAHPRPFHGGLLQVDFSTPAAGTHIEVALYDMSGRLVRSLYSGCPGGASRVSWDGRDGRGRTIPAGIYVLRARDSGGGQSHLKVPVIR